MRNWLSFPILLLLSAGAACQATAPLPADLSHPDSGGSADAHGQIVRNIEAYEAAAENLKPGDQIILANGVWQNFDLVLDAVGTKDAPIRLTAETPGKVILSGQSSLRLAGEYLDVSGLVFRNGYTPRGEVISFRRDSDHLARNSRVSQTVIEDYSNPDRRQVDLWVALYGQNNVFEHNHLSGKRNAGPTLAVRLDSEASQQNGHLIRYNYFGPRPVFGSNGGETLRIGTSPYSLTRSGTVVEHNYFDRCSGEVEIISNKSGGNIFRSNTFFESQGTLTLRHGSDALVENNLFDGNGAAFTGGVRIINPRQTVRNNYFRQLTGTRFSAGLVVMNGIYDSPINRYHQVDGAVIEDNIFEGVARIELGEGADAERTAPPINSVFRNNTVTGKPGEPVFRVQSSMDGVEFTENTSTAPAPAEIAYGFSIVAEGSVEADEKRMDPQVYGVSREKTGVSWYPKADAASPFAGGRDIAVAPGTGTLAVAIAAAAPGDTLVLAPGNYTEPTLIELAIPLTVRAADKTQPPALTFERANLFALSGNGALRLQGLSVSGLKAPDSTGNSFITTSARISSRNHIVEMLDMRFEDFAVNRSFSVLKADKGTFFDRISIASSNFRNVSGAILKLDAETDNFGIYSADVVDISDSEFEQVTEPVVSVYRGGTDESTFGPTVRIRTSSFKAVGAGKAPILLLHGVQNLELSANSTDSALGAELVITTGTPVLSVTDNVANGIPNGEFLQITDLRKGQ